MGMGSAIWVLINVPGVLVYIPVWEHVFWPELMMETITLLEKDCFFHCCTRQTCFAIFELRLCLHMYFNLSVPPCLSRVWCCCQFQDLINLKDFPSTWVLWQDWDWLTDESHSIGCLRDKQKPLGFPSGNDNSGWQVWQFLVWSWWLS